MGSPSNFESGNLLERLLPPSFQNTLQTFSLSLLRPVTPELLFWRILPIFLVTSPFMGHYMVEQIDSIMSLVKAFNQEGFCAFSERVLKEKVEEYVMGEYDAYEFTYWLIRYGFIPWDERERVEKILVDDKILIQ